MFLRNRQRAAHVATLTEWVELQLGYRAQPLKNSAYGKLQGANGLDWDGSFIECGLQNSLLTTGVSHVSTSTALAHYFHVNRLYADPKPGDIVFFHVSADSKNPVGQPHIGLVTDTRDWQADGVFHTIEGQVAPEAKQANQEATAVARRVRYSTDVLAFARPDYQELTFRSGPDNNQTVKVSRFHVRGVSRDISRAQKALHRVFPFFRGAQAGKLDGPTLSAFERYRRSKGRVQPDTPWALTLQDLADDTGDFLLED